MKNLFDKKDTKTAAKGKERVSAELENQENPLRKLVELDEKIAALQAERKLVDSEVRELSTEAMIGLYDAKKSFPGTIRITAGPMELQFITADRYKIIDKDRAKELAEKYGEALVNEETKFSFNTAILMNNMDTINKMIVKSKDISESDKENLIEQSTSWNVTKGTIKDLRNENYAKFNLGEMIDDIKPVFSIKSIKETE